MLSLASQKDPEVLAVLDALGDRIGRHSFIVVDHWPDDPQAIGVASPSNQQVLAYISASSGAEKPYFVSLEHPPAGEWAEHPYSPEGDRNVCELEELLQFVTLHLAKAGQSGSGSSGTKPSQ